MPMFISHRKARLLNSETRHLQNRVMLEIHFSKAGGRKTFSFLSNISWF